MAESDKTLQKVCLDRHGGKMVGPVLSVLGVENIASFRVPALFFQLLKSVWFGCCDLKILKILPAEGSLMEQSAEGANDKRKPRGGQCQCSSVEPGADVLKGETPCFINTPPPK